jgi:hypothetical protein
LKMRYPVILTMGSNQGLFWEPVEHARGAGYSGRRESVFANIPNRDRDLSIQERRWRLCHEVTGRDPKVKARGQEKTARAAKQEKVAAGAVKGKVVEAIAIKTERKTASQPGKIHH